MVLHSQVYSPPGTKKKGKNPLKHMEVFCSIPSRSLLSPSYYHSFGVTENYVIFLEQPFKLDILKMATAYMRGVSWASCMSFHREDKVRPSCLPTPLEGCLLGTLTALACLCRQLPPSGEFRCWDGFTKVSLSSEVPTSKCRYPGNRM